MASFPDHFSSTAAGYASFRPSYPAALFEWLGHVASHHAVAWDCGTGSGQAAVALADHFDFVVATDPSTMQLAHAASHPRVRYAAMTATWSALANRSASVITVAQALHWFDTPAFFAEARRVLAPRGVIAVWSYGVLTLDECTRLERGLDAVERRLMAGEQPIASDEDVHTMIDRLMRFIRRFRTPREPDLPPLPLPPIPPPPPPSQPSNHSTRRKENRARALEAQNIQVFRDYQELEAIRTRRQR